jgi:DNA-binding response OmpR family regulator
MIKNKILLEEDDGDIILWIQEYLQEFGFEITVVDTVTDAISYVSQYHFDIVLLDLNLPDYSGYEVLKYIAQNKPLLPIIVASGNDDQKSKLHAFNLGASDYMVKPLDLAELEARIRVHTKHTKAIFEEKSLKSNDELFQIVANKILFKKNPLPFTKTEFDIVALLIENKNSTVSRDKLCDSLSSVNNHRALDYHIRNIRVKLGEDSSTPMYLTTEYGVGYKLCF